MWNKILIPLDGSELAERILALVVRVLERRSVLSDEDEDAVELKLLRVVTQDELRQGERLARDEVAVAREALRASLARLGEYAAHATTEVVVGDPAGVILDAALQWKPTLVAMSTHGRTGLERLVVRGSVAERVLRSSPFPLLLANPDALDAAKTTLPFQRILVPIDGSERSNEVLPRVAEVARFFDAEVVLFHVVTVWFIEGEAGAGIRVREAEGNEALARARALLADVRVRTRLEFGAPAAAIFQAVAEENADLLALTTHGRSGPSRWALGSVAENVLRHSRCPILLQRTNGLAASTAPADEESAKSVA